MRTIRAQLPSFAALSHLLRFALIRTVRFILRGAFGKKAHLPQKINFQIMQSLKDLWRGIKKHPVKLLGYAFTAFSILLTVFRGLNLIPGVEIDGWLAFWSVLAMSIIYALKKVWKPSKIKIKVANSDTTIEVLFGDLFAQDGLRAIAVNEFFDSQLGKPVSAKSVHGYFLNKCFGGHPEPFDKQVDEQLANEKHEVIPRPQGRAKKYKIGTTAIVTAESDRYLVFALTHTDSATCMATADVTMMWIALHHVWQRARAECSGNPLNLPLVGGGLAKIGLPTRDLLNLIILAAITETKEKVITQQIRIVLHRDRFEDLDLRDVENHWRE